MESTEEGIVFRAQFIERAPIIGRDLSALYNDVRNEPSAGQFLIEPLKTSGNESDDERMEQSYSEETRRLFKKAMELYISTPNRQWILDHFRVVSEIPIVTRPQHLEPLWQHIEQLFQTWADHIQGALLEIPEEQPRRFLDTFIYFIEIWTAKAENMPDSLYWISSRFLVPKYGVEVDAKIKSIFTVIVATNKAVLEKMCRAVAKLVDLARAGVAVDFEPISRLLSFYNDAFIDGMSNSTSIASIIMEPLLDVVVPDVRRLLDPYLSDEPDATTISIKGWIKRVEDWRSKEEIIWNQIDRCWVFGPAMVEHIEERAVSTWLDPVVLSLFSPVLHGRFESFSRVLALASASKKTYDAFSAACENMVRNYVASMTELSAAGSVNIIKGYYLVTLARSTFLTEDGLSGIHQFSFEEIWKTILPEINSVQKMLAEVLVHEIQYGKDMELQYLSTIRQLVDLLDDSEEFNESVLERLSSLLVPRNTKGVCVSITDNTIAHLSERFDHALVLKVEVMWRDLLGGQALFKRFNQITQSSNTLEGVELLGPEDWKFTKPLDEPVWDMIRPHTDSFTEFYRAKHERRLIDWSGALSLCSVTLQGPNTITFTCSVDQAWIISTIISSGSPVISIAALKTAVPLAWSLLNAALRDLVEYKLLLWGPQADNVNFEDNDVVALQVPDAINGKLITKIRIAS